MPEHQQTQQSKKTNTIFQKQATPISQIPVSNPYSIIQRARINPKSLTHADIMQLQRTIGNQAVGRLLSSIGNTSTAQQATVQRQEIPEKEETCPSCIQKQETPEEEEPLQGKMSETVQRQEVPEEEEPLQGKMIETIQRQEIPEEEEPLQGKMSETVQRQEIPEEEEPLQGKMAETLQLQDIPEEEKPLQGKFENKPETACPSCFSAPIVQRQELEEEEPLQGKMIETIQRQEVPEEEEPLQGKMAETVQRQEIPEEEEPLQKKRENNTGMSDNLKAGVESLSGIDMGDVRVHYNSYKPAEVGALAYTQGTEIHVAPEQEKHLPHEAWHVVQQAQGRVRPTLQLRNVPINDDAGLEHEADVMGTKANATQFRGEPEEAGRLQRAFTTARCTGPKQAEFQKTSPALARSDSSKFSYRRSSLKFSGIMNPSGSTAVYQLMEEEGGWKKDDTRTHGPQKVRGGHKGEHALPIQMQRDPNYAAWYHSLKQNKPGWLSQILGQSISADYNIDSKGERKLRPYWEAEKRDTADAREKREERQEQKLVPVGSESESQSSDDESSDDESSDDESSGDEYLIHLDQINSAIGELQDDAARIGDLEPRGRSKLGKRFTKRATDFLVLYRDDQYAMNKYRIVKAMYDVADEYMPPAE